MFSRMSAPRGGSQNYRPRRWGSSPASAGRSAGRVALALSVFFLALAGLPPAASAQCPVPGAMPPALDGSLDPVYVQFGGSTDYIASNVNATARLYQIDDTCIDPNFIYLAWEIDLGFVDNSYGANRNLGAKFPWDGGHSFFDLTESDGQRLQILNVCGEDVVDLFMDLIDGPNVPGPEYGTPSGYEVVQPSSCGAATCAETIKFLINGGDWTGFNYDTSLAYNLNDLGFCTNDGPGGAPPDCDDAGTDLLVDSPPWSNEDDFIPQSPYDAWEYRHLYEMRIDRTVFSTASCPQGTPALIRTDPVELHASPSKLAENRAALFRAYSTIGDYVWFDVDRDGIQDAGESGIANVTVALYRDDGDGVLEPHVTVLDGRLDVNGDGVVDAADDGSYSGVTVIDGLLDLDGDGVAGETNGDDSGTLNTITVIDGRLDIDGDGDVDTADDGLAAGDDGAPRFTTVTDSHGLYTFTRLSADNYIVDITDDNGVLAGLALTVGPQSETDPSAPIALPRQQEYVDADFGYAPADLTTAAVGNYVWSDADDDGIQDPGEAGIGGVTMQLVDADTLTVVDTTVTAADGTYLFTGVPPGNYYVDSDTAGVLGAYTLTVGPQSETDPSTGFQLQAGDVYLNADFGYFNAALGALGNQVWFDVDEDGVFAAGEPGIGNVTLALIADADGDGVRDAGELIVASTSTANDGTYSFPGLPLDDGGGDADADYLVVVTDVRDVLGQFLESVYLPLGSTLDDTSKVGPYAAALSAGQPVNSTADFGFLLDNPLALLGDRVWYDQDGDGMQDPTEPGIEGVRMVLLNDKNKNGQIDAQDVFLSSRTTDLNGSYYFQRLDFDANGEGYHVLVSEFNAFDVFSGLLDLDGDGTAGGAGDDGSVDGVTVIDGRLDLDGDGTIETNGDDSGELSGYRVINGRLDLDSDGTIETNGDDSRFAPLGNFTQTGDPDEAGTCATCDGRSASVLSDATLSDLTRDFGYDGIGTFSIGDTVYHDLNADGTQDAGEPGLELVTLALYEDLDGDGVIDINEPLIAQDVTDAAGGYLFDDLVAGDYIVAITDNFAILTGYTQTQGSPFEPVASGELSTLEKDFGFVRSTPATISNFVWEDLNGNGVQDAGEPGVPNVTVNLWNPGADGMPGGGDDVLVGTQTTSSAGLYGFTVQAGAYFIEVVPPPGYAITGQNLGGDDALDSDIDPVTGRAAVTTLLIAEADPTWDAGLYRPVAVGDRVWLDVDGDGVEDVGEPGIANVYVELWDAGANGAPGGGDDTFLGRLLTDGDGNYLFPGRPPSAYFVDVVEATVPPGLALSGGTDPSSGSTLTSGQIVLTKDFGYTDDGDAVIGDLVWSDADGDGVQDPGEPGIGGVTLDLIGAGPDGLFGTADDTSATTTTAADGSYLFTGVAAGKYVVDVTDTGGVLAGYTLTSGPQSSTDPTAPITVAAGDVYVRADFGYFQAGLGTLGTHVWLDADDDGIRDAGEAGIADVSLALVRDANGDGAWDPDGLDNLPGTADDEVILATTLTAADGGYAFTGLSLDDGGGDGDADYLVTVTDTGGVLAGFTKTTGLPAGADDRSQVDPYAVALSAGAPSDPTADFGYNRPGTIGDRVWSDADGDGVQDPGEAGIGGVQVDLLGPGPDLTIGTADDVVLASRVTAADGSYLFTLLLPGDYRVVVDETGVLAAYTQTGDPDEAGTCVVCDAESTTTLAAGGSDLTRDFGYRNLALFDISGTVFYDGDVDGFHDEPPEVGIAGVTLELWHDVDGNGLLDPAVDERVSSTTTDGIGDYLFPDLPDDDYLVVVTDDAGVLEGHRLTSGLDRIPVTLAGADVFDVDFGYVRDGGAGSIGDTVWLDSVADGLQGPNEAGIAGVTVRLYEDVDRDGALEPNVSVIDGRIDLDGDGDVDAEDDGVLAGVGILDGRFDVNGDGVIDATDDGSFNGATVIDGLLDLDGDGTAGETNGDDTGALAGDDGAPLDTRVTDADGRYLFDGLAADVYFLDVDETTLPDASADGNPDLVETTYPAGVDPSAQIPLADGEDYRLGDFGFLPASGTAAFGDRVWYDADSDGLQDPGEVGIAGVDVLVRDSVGNVTTYTTGADGLWWATGLAPGDYVITFDPLTLPAGYNTTPTNNGGNNVYNATVAVGDLFTHLDFGFDGGVTGSIGDTVYFDADADGVEDPGEPGIGGVTLNLVDPVTGAILATTTTAPSGFYEFTGLPAGSYDVVVTDIDGVLTGLNLSTAPIGTIALAAGENYDLADFGYTASRGVGVLGDFVWHDLNGDGLQDPGEPGIEGVVLELWQDVDGNGVVGAGDNLLRTTSTDQSGFYEFKALPAGSFVVRVADAAGVLDGFTPTADPDEAGVCATCDLQGATTLAVGGSDLTLDFGFQAPPATAYSIAGTVYEDADRDAFYDEPGESVVQGATLYLYRDLDGDGVVDPGDPRIGTTTSNASGDYLFDNLPPGDYIVEVVVDGTRVDGFVQTTQSATGGVQPVEIVDQDIVDQDFGFWNGGITTTPVTLAWFKASGSGGFVELEWLTATEVGNLGFNLYALEGERLRQLNEELIPSHVVDSLEPQKYRFEAWGVEGDRFLIEDVDIVGDLRYHGPFRLNEAAGSEKLEREAIDWAGIRAASERRRTAQRAERLAGGFGVGGRRAAAARLEVERDGIHRVSYEALAAAGVDLAGTPRAHLALVSQGEPVPILVGGRGVFGPGSWVEFVGRGLDTLYTRTNVYTLKVDRSLARRIRPLMGAGGGGTPAEFYLESKTVESDRLYHFAAPGEDPWYDARLLATTGPVEASFALDLEGLVPGAGPIELEVSLWGVTDFPQSPDHHVVLEVNGVEVADELFDGLTERLVSVEVPSWLVGQPEDVLTVKLPHDTGARYDLVNYDRYRVSYPRHFVAQGGRLTFTAAAETFRVDGLPSAAVRVYRERSGAVEHVARVEVSGVPGAYSATFAGSEEAATYHVSTVESVWTAGVEPARPEADLLSGNAELLVISHADFLSGIEPLVAARRAEGYSVKVVDVEDVYARYSHGVFDPRAIRAYIAAAWKELTTDFVLLVGGDSYDYHDNLGLGAVSFVPSLYARTDAIVHYAPVDPLYTDVDGDLVPDLAIGRLPVRTPAELDGVVRKTLEYGAVAYSGSALLAADAFDLGSGYSFTQASEEMRSLLPDEWQVEPVYLDEMELAEARAALIGGINEGVALTSYFGHSGPTVWSFQGLFASADAEALENAGRPTVVTQWGCWNTYYVTPAFNTLGHKLLLDGDRGGAAVLGAATLTEARSERLLGRRLFEQIGGQRQPLGWALLNAKRDLATIEPDRLDVLLGWTLLGDPTLVVEP